MKTVYVAYDGKTFDSKESCEKYETMLTRKTLVSHERSSFNNISLLQAQNGDIYVQIATGNWHEGGVIFDGTFEEFVDKYFDKIVK